ncbi:MAG TPA: peptidase inhibitor family I36 protein [Streptosporangiaceae bacterium]|nr:peptidase inhibitor family I36 protein [Streptosporangiaceae bacterium]
MRFRRAVIGVGIMSVFTFCGPIGAAGTVGTCANGSVCMWEDAGYSGSKYVDQPGNPGKYQIDWWNGDNEISSVINRTGKCVRLYDNDNWSGTSYFIEKAGSRWDLERNGFDNEAESYTIFNC